MNSEDDHHETSEHYAIRKPETGAPPGAGIARKSDEDVSIRVCAYGPGEVEMTTVSTFTEAAKFRDDLPHRWIAVEGGTHHDLMREAADQFDLPLLVLEDVATQRTWPKVEYLDDHTFIVARWLTYGESLKSEQLSLVVTTNYVLSFHEHDSSAFDAIRKRIQNANGYLRKLKADYMAYALLDIMVDTYFISLEAIGIHLDELENEVFDESVQPNIEQLHRARHDLLLARRSIRPLREVLNSLLRSSDSPMQEETKPFLRDCYDHAVEALEFVETYRELVSSLFEIYMTVASHRTNEIMRVLTLVSSIFIPLGFIAGVYGMNFDSSISPYNMPELHSPWGYPIVIGIMASIAIGLIVLFVRKGWIGGFRSL